MSTQGIDPWIFILCASNLSQKYGDDDDDDDDEEDREEEKVSVQKLVQKPRSKKTKPNPLTVTAPPPLFKSLAYSDVVSNAPSHLKNIRVYDCAQSDTNLVLPLRLCFQNLVASSSGKPSIVWTTLWSKDKMINTIDNNPLYPDHIRGQSFSSLSKSGLAIKSSSLNGFLVWYFKTSQGTYEPIDQYRQYLSTEDDYQAPTLKLCDTKNSKLIEGVDCTVSERPDFIPASKPYARDRKPRQAKKEETSREDPATTTVDIGLHHAANILMNYFQKVFECNVNYIMIDTEDGFYTYLPGAIEKNLGAWAASSRGMPDFVSLGFYILYKICKDATYMTGMKISRNTTMSDFEGCCARGLIKELGDDFIEFYPFTLDKDFITPHGGSSVSISSMVSEISTACGRDMLKSMIEDTDGFYSLLLA